MRAGARHLGQAHRPGLPLSPARLLHLSLIVIFFSFCNHDRFFSILWTKKYPIIFFLQIFFLFFSHIWYFLSWFIFSLLTSFFCFHSLLFTFYFSLFILFIIHFLSSPFIIFCLFIFLFALYTLEFSLCPKEIVLLNKKVLCLIENNSKFANDHSILLIYSRCRLYLEIWGPSYHNYHLCQWNETVCPTSYKVDDGVWQLCG